MVTSSNADSSSGHALVVDAGPFLLPYVISRWLWIWGGHPSLYLNGEPQRSVLMNHLGNVDRIETWLV